MKNENYLNAYTIELRKESGTIAEQIVGQVLKLYGLTFNEPDFELEVADKEKPSAIHHTQVYSNEQTKVFLHLDKPMPNSGFSTFFVTQYNKLEVFIKKEELE